MTCIFCDQANSCKNNYPENMKALRQKISAEDLGRE